MDVDDFSFLKVIPEHLTHGVYCAPCYNEKISPEIHSYEETMAKAKEVYVFLKGQKETRLFKRLDEPLEVKDCEDKNEVLLRLAFLAAKSNFNTIIDVVVTAQKLRAGVYQTSKFQAVGIPVHVNPNNPLLHE